MTNVFFHQPRSYSLRLPLPLPPLLPLLLLCNLVGSCNGASHAAQTRDPSSPLTAIQQCPSLRECNFWGPDLGPELVNHARQDWTKIPAAPADDDAAPPPVDATLSRAEASARPAICIYTTYLATHTELRSLTLPNKLAYARKYGYRVFTERDIPSKVLPRYAHFTKMAGALWLMQAHEEDASFKACDWVMWTDADSFINNFDVDLASFTAAADSHHADFIFSWDERWYCRSDGRCSRPNLGDYTFLRINSGQWLARNSPYARAFLSEALTLTPPKRTIYTYWHDQGAMAEVVARRGAEDVRQGHFLFYDYRAFNTHVFSPEDASLHQYDFILHRPGACRRKGEGKAECAKTIRELMEATGAHKLAASVKAMTATKDTSSKHPHQDL